MKMRTKITLAREIAKWLDETPGDWVFWTSSRYTLVHHSQVRVASTLWAHISLAVPSGGEPSGEIDLGGPFSRFTPWGMILYPAYQRWKKRETARLDEKLLLSLPLMRNSQPEPGSFRAFCGAGKSYDQHRAELLMCVNTGMTDLYHRTYSWRKP